MKYRALIVDDERIIVNGIMRLPIWLSLDIEPVPAMTGLQALELMEQYRFDLIITDIRMPEMDGLEFISQMRKCTRTYRPWFCPGMILSPMRRRLSITVFLIIC